MSERNEKVFNGPNQTRFRFTGLFTLKKELLPENLLLRKVLLLKVCELKEKTPSLWLGKDDNITNWLSPNHIHIGVLGSLVINSSPNLVSH